MRTLRLLALLGLCWGLLGCEQATRQLDRWFPQPKASDYTIYQRTQVGRQLYNKKQYDQALKLFLNLQSQYPKRLDLMYNLGAVHLQLGMHSSSKGTQGKKHFRQAEEYLTGVLTKGSAKLRQRAHYNLGVLFTQKRLYEKALFHFEQSVFLANKTLKKKDKDAESNRDLLATLLRQRARRRQKLNRTRVFRYEPKVIQLRASRSYSDPIRQIALRAVFTHIETHQKQVIWGYPISKRRWQVRFIPTRTGKWRYAIQTVVQGKGTQRTQKDASLRDEGLFRVMPSARPGRLIIATANPTQWAWKKPKTDLKLKKKKSKTSQGTTKGKGKKAPAPQRTTKKKKPALPKDEKIIRWQGLGIPGLFSAKRVSKASFAQHVKLLQQIQPTALHVPIQLGQLVRWTTDAARKQTQPQMVAPSIQTLIQRLQQLRSNPAHSRAFVYILRAPKKWNPQQLKTALRYILARLAHVDALWSLSELPKPLKTSAQAVLHAFDPYKQVIAQTQLPTSLRKRLQAHTRKVQALRQAHIQALAAYQTQKNNAGPQRPKPTLKLPKPLRNTRYAIHTSHHIATSPIQLQKTLYSPWIGDLPLPLELSSKALLEQWWKLYTSGIRVSVWLDRSLHKDEHGEVVAWLRKMDETGTLPAHPSQTKKMAPKTGTKASSKKKPKSKKPAPRTSKVTSKTTSSKKPSKSASKQTAKDKKGTSKDKKGARKKPIVTPIQKRISRPFIHYLIVRHRWKKFLDSFRFTGLVKPMMVRVRAPDFKAFQEAIRTWQKQKKAAATSKPSSKGAPAKQALPQPKMRWKHVGMRGYLAGNVTTILFLAPPKKVKKPPQIRWQKRRMDMEFSWYNATTGTFLKKQIFRQVTSLALTAPKKPAHIAKVVIKDHPIHTAYRIALPYRFAPVTADSSWRARDWQIVVTPPKGPKQRLAVILDKNGYFGQFRPDAPGFWRFALLHKGKRLKGVWGYDGMIKVIPAQQPVPLFRHPRVAKRFLAGSPQRPQPVMVFATPIPSLLSKWSQAEFQTTIQQLPKKRPASNLVIAALPRLPWGSFDALQKLKKTPKATKKSTKKAASQPSQGTVQLAPTGSKTASKHPSKLSLLHALTQLEKKIQAIHKAGRLLTLTIEPKRWKTVPLHIQRARMLFLMDRFASAYPLMWIIDQRKAKGASDTSFIRWIKQWYFVHYPHPAMLLRMQGKKVNKAALQKASKVPPSAWPPLVGVALGTLRSEKRLKATKGYDFLWLNSGNLTTDIRDFKLGKETRPTLLTWKPLTHKNFSWTHNKAGKQIWNTQKTRRWARFLWRSQLLGFSHVDRAVTMPWFASSKSSKKQIQKSKLTPIQRIPGVMRAFFGLFNWMQLQSPIRSMGLKSYQAFGAETPYNPKGKQKQHHAVIWVNQTVRKNLILKQKMKLKKHRYIWLDPLSGKRPVSPQLLPLPPKGKPNTLRVPFRPAVLYVYRRPPQRKKQNKRQNKRNRKKQNRQQSKRQQVRNKLKNLRENRNKMLRKMLGKPKHSSGKRG